LKLGFPNLGSSGAVLLVLAVEVFIIMLGLGLANPILPLYAQSFGVGAAAVGSRAFSSIFPPATGPSGSVGDVCSFLGLW